MGEGKFGEKGGGKEVRYWLDKWIGDRRLNERWPRHFRPAEDKQMVISDMGVWEGEQWSWRWRWRRDLFQWEVELFTDFAGILQAAKPRKVEMDSWMWRSESSGAYLVKSAYKLITATTHNGEDHFFTTLWSRLVPHKVDALG